MASLTGSQVDVQDRQELYDFLDKLKLIKYYHLLCENECYPLSVLRHVDDSSLKEWGVKTIPRKAIMRAIAKISRASIPSLDKTFLAPPPSGKIAAAQLQEDARVAAEMIMKAKIGNPAPPSDPAPPGPPSAKIAAAQQLEDEIKLLKQKKNKALNDDDDDEEARLGKMIKQAKAKLNELKKSNKDNPAPPSSPPPPSSPSPANIAAAQLKEDTRVDAEMKAMIEMEKTDTNSVWETLNGSEIEKTDVSHQSFGLPAPPPEVYCNGNSAPAPPPEVDCNGNSAPAPPPEVDCNGNSAQTKEAEEVRIKNVEIEKNDTKSSSPSPTAKAIYDYVAKRDSKVMYHTSLKLGENVIVLDGDTGGWTRVQSSTGAGYVPSSYLTAPQEAPEESVPDQPIRKVGDPVEVEFEGGTYYKGYITLVHEPQITEDGDDIEDVSYDVLFEDFDRRAEVAENEIRDGKKENMNFPFWTLVKLAKKQKEENNHH